MSDVTPARSNIQTEEVQYKAAVSEATGFKIGGAVNFINDRQYDTKRFDINGNYSINVASGKQGVDGAQPVLFNCEIVGICMFNLKAGSSGVTTLNIRKYTASNTPISGTSIFSVKPSLSFTSGDYSFLFKRFTDNVLLQNPTGATQPTLLSVNLTAGELLVVDIDASQVDAENCGIILFTRPR